MQLAAKLPLAVDCRHKLSANVNVTDGLANGASGVTKQIKLLIPTVSMPRVLYGCFSMTSTLAHTLELTVVHYTQLTLIHSGHQLHHYADNFKSVEVTATRYCESNFHYVNQQLKRSTGRRATPSIRWLLTLRHLTVAQSNLSVTRVHVFASLRQ